MATVSKSGPQDMCESHRGVLTASTMGKKGICQEAARGASALACAEGTWLSVWRSPSQKHRDGDAPCQDHHAQGEASEAGVCCPLHGCKKTRSRA